MIAFLRLFLKFYLALNSYIFIIKKALLFSILLSRIMVKMARIVKRHHLLTELLFSQRWCLRYPHSSVK